VGSCLASSLINEKKYKVAIIDYRKDKKIKLSKKIKIYNSNINNLKILKQINDEFKPTHIFHLAALTSAGDSQKKKKTFYMNNVINSKIFIDFFIKKKIKNFFFSSTASVYQNSNKKNDENSKLRPPNYYGKTKFLIEQYLKRKAFKLNLNINVFRFFNVVGAKKDLKYGLLNVKSNHLFQNICKSIIFNKIFQIYGHKYKTIDGTCVRDFIDVNDLIDVLVFFLNKKKSNNFEIFNISSNNAYSVLEIIKKFQNVLKIKINYNFKKKRDGDQAISTCNNKKLLTFYHTKFNNINQTITSHYNFYKKNKNFFYEK
jgi:UDP-glucose 4-epimerase